MIQEKNDGYLSKWNVQSIPKEKSGKVLHCVALPM